MIDRNHTPAFSIKCIATLLFVSCVVSPCIAGGKDTTIDPDMRLAPVDAPGPDCKGNVCVKTIPLDEALSITGNTEQSFKHLSDYSAAGDTGNEKTLPADNQGKEAIKK